MSVKEKVLKVLEENKGETISGEVFANKFLCSRNAVCKAIKSLRQDGYKIESTTNKGYKLVEESTDYNALSIKKFIKEDVKLIFLDEVDSTNNYLKKSAEKGEKENTVVVALRQNGGKGRKGRKFFSSDSGVYFSILLKPEFSAEKSLFITTAAAVAVSKAVEKLSNKKTGIKWVNDVYIDNKKICGILTEASIDFESGGLNFAIVGIGINVFCPKEDFPKEISKIAGAVFENNETDKMIKQKIVGEVINEFLKIYNDFNKLNNSDYMKYYKEKSILIGKKITVLKNNETLNAYAVDIDDNARLLVEYENGEKEYLSSGEVSIRI